MYKKPSWSRKSKKQNVVRFDPNIHIFPVGMVIKLNYRLRSVALLIGLPDKKYIVLDIVTFYSNEYQTIRTLTDDGEIRVSDCRYFECAE